MIASGSRKSTTLMAHCAMRRAVSLRAQSGFTAAAAAQMFALVSGVAAGKLKRTAGATNRYRK